MSEVITKPPTAKQVKYASIISETLSIKLPKEQTSYAYWKFIHDHEDKYHKHMSQGLCDFMEEYGNFGDYC